MNQKKTETLSFKISQELKERIIIRAEEENRSLSNFCVTIIENYLDKIDEAKKLIK